ncbi:MAG: AAA family ATPase, partial [Muribaculaceae bacterium]|nr:AAA family ATPase [Muribaculaceae bacterium]
MENAYADICGWTEEELIGKFRKGIEDLAVDREEDFLSTLMALRNYYDGYLFASKGSRVYNPFSVLNALDMKDIRPFWYDTATPSFLARRIRKNGIDPMEINGVVASIEDLTAIGFDETDPVPLMFQTGYLTVDSYDRETQLYSLRFPNREVE